MAELVMSAAEIAADPARWLEERRGGVTATDAATILGVSPWDSPFALWHRKKGNLPERPDNDRMRLGRYLEQYVAERWAEVVRHDWTCPADWRGGLYRDGWRMATPDFVGRDWRTDQLFTLECKTVASWEGWGHGIGCAAACDERERCQFVPPYVRVQALWQADVLGVPVAHVAALHRQSGEFRWYTLELSDDQPSMIPECQRFYESLQAGTPPPVDGAEATTRALQHLHAGADPARTAYLDRSLVNRWERIRGALVTAQMDADLIKNEVREAMGDAKYARYIDEEGTEWRIAQRIQSKVSGHWVAPHERDELRYGRKQVNDAL